MTRNFSQQRREQLKRLYPCTCCCTLFLIWFYIFPSIIGLYRIFSVQSLVPVINTEVDQTFSLEDYVTEETVITPPLLVELERMLTIPPIIHHLSPTEKVPMKWKGAYATCVGFHGVHSRLKDSYTFIVWTDDSIRKFIAKTYPWFLKTFDSYPYQIQRVDAARYFILRSYGGIYLDLDVGCRKDFSEMLATSYGAILPQTTPAGVSNDVMAARPGHPFFVYVTEHLASFNTNYWLSKFFTVMLSTGPLRLSILLYHYQRSLRSNALGSLSRSRLWKGALEKQEEEKQKEIEIQREAEEMAKNESIKAAENGRAGRNHHHSRFHHSSNHHVKDTNFPKIKDKYYNVGLLSNHIYTKVFFFHIPGNSWNDSLDGIIINALYNHFYFNFFIISMAVCIGIVYRTNPTLLTRGKLSKKTKKALRGGVKWMRMGLERVGVYVGKGSERKSERMKDKRGSSGDDDTEVDREENGTSGESEDDDVGTDERYETGKNRGDSKEGKKRRRRHRQEYAVGDEQA